MIDILWLIFFIIMFLMALSTLRSNYNYLENLSRKKYWYSIKSDNPIFGEAKTQYRVIIFLFKREYNDDTDAEFVDESNKIRKNIFTYFIALMIFLFLTINVM